MSAERRRRSLTWQALAPHRWAVWSESWPVLATIVVVEAVAVTAVAVSSVVAVSSAGVGGPLGWAGPWTAAAAGGAGGTGGTGGARGAGGVAVLLAVTGVAQLEIVRVVERARRAVMADCFFNFAGVWTFAAVLLLPSTLAVGVVMVVSGHLWWRTRHPFYRSLYTAVSVVLAAVAVDGVTAWVTAGGAAGVSGVSAGVAVVGGTGPLLLAGVLALVVYAVVQQGVVTLVVAVADPRRSWSALLGSAGDNVMEGATLCLGALAAAAMLTAAVLVVLVPLPLVVLQRAALVRELRKAVDTDAKTGLLTAPAWTDRAEQLLAPDHPDRAGRGAVRRRGPGRIIGVAMADLDHFKRVNDVHGHLVGDQVLRAVAEVLRGAVRATDLVARFGGEEFLVLIVADPHEHTGRADTARVVAEVAERIRARVEALQVHLATPDGPLTLSPLTVSIGAVTLPAATPGPATPGSGSRRPYQLCELIAAADRAVFTAKRAGRNRVTCHPI